MSWKKKRSLFEGCVVLSAFVQLIIGSGKRALSKFGKLCWNKA
jgi:hypothetical protein